MSQNSSKRKASESAGAAARVSMIPTRKKCGCPITSSCLQSHSNKDYLPKHFKDAKTKCGANSRLCGDLTDLERHLLLVGT
eukprot:8788764-Ditylum_brightwellii.AAC.1